MITYPPTDAEGERTEYFYDEHGNDTAVYTNKKLYQRTVYEYKAGKIQKAIRYGENGREIATTIYTYNPNGTFVGKNTDKQFGMKDYTYYNKLGKITKPVMPDRSEQIYFYNAAGKLAKIVSNVSKPIEGSVIVNTAYTYNSKGQLIKKVSTGDYKWSTTYTYNTRGLIAKSINSSMLDGEPEPEIITNYEYEFRN